MNKFVICGYFIFIGYVFGIVRHRLKEDGFK